MHGRHWWINREIETRKASFVYSLSVSSAVSRNGAPPMATLLASSHSSILTRNPKPLRRTPPSLRRTPPSLPFSSAPRNPRLFSAPRNPRLFSAPARFAVPGDGSRQNPRRIPTGKPSEVDEGGERSAPEPEPPSEPDPAKDEDEWGKEVGAASAGVVDQRGERAEPEQEEPEQEAPAEPDPAKDEDDSGREPEVAYQSRNGSVPVVSDKLGDLKRCLVDTLYGTELGLRTSGEVRGEILELINQLEAENPTRAPTEKPELLDGNWILLYTAFSELLPLLAIGATPLLKIKKISQAIDTNSMTIVNATTLSSPFASFSFSATASFEIQSPSRIQVQFKEGDFEPPEVSSTVDLPANIDVFGQKIDLSPVQQSLNPVQEAAANIARTISGQPPLKVRIPGDRGPPSWLLITYLDEDFRISRGDGGLFVLAKEGSPLLDQLS